MQVNVEFQEPDKKKRIKRIIAREGLILLIIITTGIILVIINSVFGLYLVFGYPIYLLIRFIIWAIKTLKEK